MMSADRDDGERQERSASDLAPASSPSRPTGDPTDEGGQEAITTTTHAGRQPQAGGHDEVHEQHSNDAASRRATADRHRARSPSATRAAQSPAARASGSSRHQGDLERDEQGEAAPHRRTGAGPSNRRRDPRAGPTVPAGRARRRPRQADGQARSPILDASCAAWRTAPTVTLHATGVAPVRPPGQQGEHHAPAATTSQPWPATRPAERDVTGLHQPVRGQQAWARSRMKPVEPSGNQTPPRRPRRAVVPPIAGPIESGAEHVAEQDPERRERHQADEHQQGHLQPAPGRQPHAEQQCRPRTAARW